MNKQYFLRLCYWRVDAIKAEYVIESVEHDTYTSDLLLPALPISEEYMCLGAALILPLCAYQISVSHGLEPGDMRYCDWVIK